MRFIFPPVTGEAAPLGDTDPSSCPKGRESHEGEGEGGCSARRIGTVPMSFLTEAMFRRESLLFYQNGPRNVIVFQRFCFIVLEEGFVGCCLGDWCPGG